MAMGLKSRNPIIWKKPIKERGHNAYINV